LNDDEALLDRQHLQVVAHPLHAFGAASFDPCGARESPEGFQASPAAHQYALEADMRDRRSKHFLFCILAGQSTMHKPGRTQHHDSSLAKADLHQESQLPQQSCEKLVFSSFVCEVNASSVHVPHLLLCSSGSSCTARRQNNRLASTTGM
jgi:hypothetical protein